MNEEAKKQERKRRTPEELRAHYQEKLKGLEENEKREVIRLLSGVADDLQKASTYKCCPQPEVNQAIHSITSALKKLGA